MDGTSSGHIYQQGAPALPPEMGGIMTEGLALSRERATWDRMGGKPKNSLGRTSYASGQILLFRCGLWRSPDMPVPGRSYGCAGFRADLRYCHNAARHP